MKRDFYKTLQTIQAAEGKKDLEKIIKFSPPKIYLFKKNFRPPISWERNQGCSKRGTNVCGSTAKSRSET